MTTLLKHLVAKRTPAQIARLFEAFDLVAPGIVSATQWPDIPEADLDIFVGCGSTRT